jgi:condensin complex subunit 1
VDQTTKFAAAMSQTLGVLATSGLEELAADGLDKGDPMVTAHRSAIHAYAFFLSCVHDSIRTRVLEGRKAEVVTKGA